MPANDFDTVAGTQLFVSTAAPATNDAAGFGAIATWTQVQGLTNIGSVKGREYNTTTMSFVDSEQDIEKKGTFKLPNADFECAWIEDDAGQIIIDTASKSKDIISCKVVKPGGAIRYFRSQVLKFVENNGAGNDAVKGNFTLLRQTDTISA